jgi:hypothetical protein
MYLIPINNHCKEVCLVSYPVNCDDATEYGPTLNYEPPNSSSHHLTCCAKSICVSLEEIIVDIKNEILVQIYR